MATEAPVLIWFRRDLRLADNPALAAAVATGRPIVPVFILDEAPERRPVGAASRWWLDKSLRRLAEAIAARGGRLILRRGESEAVLRELLAATGAEHVVLNRLFEPDASARDADLAHALKADGIEMKGYNATLLTPPGTVRTGGGGPYKVFTPFLRALLAATTPPPALPDSAGAIFAGAGVASEDLDGWGLHPTAPDWSGRFDWEPGESGALEALRRFTAGPLADYARLRDLPGKAGTSRLSPHLHWGEISPWRAVLAAREAAAAGRVSPAEADKFIAEIGWREFSAHLLADFPHIATQAFKPEYDAMPWRDDPAGLRAWQRGQTGYPVVDAGMRQLWTTGWMHNRVRMIVASFLVKHLLIDWRHGEAWFRDTLVDADLASNVQNWQWVAGSGADAAPYFRIFNPITQGQKFDPEGRYVRRWVPELARLGDRWLHAPWTAPPEVLRDAGIRLGSTYPRPVVEHEVGRKRALDALKTIGETRAAADGG
jgi:deoxyribodipyrimidine photo-lyase